MSASESLESSQRPSATRDLPGLPWKGYRWVRLVVITVLAFSLAYFVLRGVWRGYTNSGDFVVGYAAAESWLLGHDPYDLDTLKQDALRAGGPETPISQLDVLRNVYFPTTLPLFVPLALVAWSEARLVWLGLNVASALFIVFGLSRVCGWRLSSTRTLAFGAFVLALAPVHTTISLGQTSLVATAGIVAAMWLERSGRLRSTGILYGLATAVKVQIGLPFVGYVIWRRRWRTVAFATVTLGGLTIVAVVRMQASGIAWFRSWSANLALLSGPGGMNDPGPQNPDRYTLINLQYPLDTLLNGNAASTILTVAFVGFAAATMVWLIRGRYPRAELLALAIVAVLGLLVTYHRYYDAVVLAIPIAWAFSTLGTERWRSGALILILSADFLLPLQTALNDLQLRGLVPAWLTGNWFWDAVVLAQHAWTLVLMVLVLLWAAWRERSADRDTAQERSGDVRLERRSV